MSDRVDEIADALEALGGAYRGDWSDFDGRQLRRELDELAQALRGGDFELTAWARRSNLCLRCHSWSEYCNCPALATERGAVEESRP